MSGRGTTGKRFAASRPVEQRLGLLGSLAAEESLVVMDPGPICFDVVLRTTSQSPDLTGPRNWHIRRIGESPDFETYFRRGNELLSLAAQVCQLAGKCNDESV